MIISPYEQGTEEWLAARLGKPSASMFSKLITMTGKPSASADGYINQLLAERLTGKSEPHYQSEAMILGLSVSQRQEPIMNSLLETKSISLVLFLMILKVTAVALMD